MGDAQASNAGAGAGAGDTTSAEGPIVYDTSENAYEEEEEEYEDEDDMDMESESSSDDEDCEPFIDPATINTLSQAEREWALQIKAAVEEESSLHNLSDFSYAQLALVVDRGDVANALKRVKGMQVFRKEYAVNDTPAQACQSVRHVMNVHPGSFLNLDICPETGEGILAFDLGAFYPHRITTASPQAPNPIENFRQTILCEYYGMAAVNPSLQSIREGIYFLYEGSNFRWTNADTTLNQRIFDEMRDFYPTNFKKVMVYNTNSVVTLFWSLIKPFLPTKLWETLELGCQVNGADHTKPNRTLSELYLQPDTAGAEHYMLERVHRFMVQRTENEKNFRL